jgi:hypothetical protein
LLTLPHLCLPATSRRLLACLVLLLCIVVPPGVSSAVEVTSLYSAEVPLDSAARDPRSAAYGDALEAVLLRVSGSDLANDPELVDLLFPNPASYVVQFQPGEEDTLWVTFDGNAIEEVLRSNGQTVWGRERPLTLVWLAVDWGQGEREIVGADDPERSDDEARTIDRNRLLRERMLDAAERRGLPLAFPLLDTEDLARVTFPDIWGGFDELVLDASQRYEASSVLIGRVRPESGQRNRWTYHFVEEQHAWTGEPEHVVNLVADVLAAEFAIGGDAALESVELSVAGINSVDAYGSVQRMLSDTNVVESFAIVSVDGDRILYRVEAHGGAERLARALRLGGLIEQDRPESASLPGEFSTALEFFYGP